MIKAINDTDKSLLEGILKADNQKIRQVYDLVLPDVISYVKQNNGSESDARDIFQDGIIALFRRLEKADFELTCTLKSYLRIICKNLWLTRLRSKSKVELTDVGEFEEIEMDSDIVSQLEHAEKENLFFKHFNRLAESCREILMFYFDKMPIKLIAEKLNTSESYVKKRKFQCKEKLIQSIQSDTLYDEL